MQAGKIAVAWELLAVVATLLPLTAILLQFLMQFYDTGNDNINESAVGAAFFIVLSILSLTIAGYLAGDVIKFGSESSRIENAVALIQTALLLLLGAIAYLSRDVFREFGAEIPILDKLPGITDQSSNDEQEADSTDSDNPESSEVVSDG